MKPGNLERLGLQGLTGQFVGANDEYLAEFEAWAGFRLPDDYRKYLRKYGASLFGEDIGFRPVVPSPWAVNGIESFDVFYGMSERPQFDVLRVNIRLRDVVPDQMIAVGHDPGSNLILLEAGGIIYFFDRDTGQRSLCAMDFDTFLGSFEPQHRESC